MKESVDLNDLRYFVAIVEAGSLSAASRKNGVSKSFLSQHLRGLEQTLGVRLILRNTRRMSLTDLGRDFYHRCLRVLAEAEDALRLVDEARTSPVGSLKISCPVVFAQAILMPVVGSFLETHPGIHLILDADYQDADLFDDGYDLALKIQRRAPDLQLVVRAFPLDQQWLVAAPSLVKRIASPQTPADLQGINSLFLRYQGETPGNDSWTLLDSEHRSYTVQHHPRLTSSDPLVLKQAVLRGLGVALLPSSICRPQIAAGHLVRLLPDYQGDIMKLYAAYPSRQALSRATRLFLDHLGKHLPAQLREAFPLSFQPEARSKVPGLV